MLDSIHQQNQNEPKLHDWNIIPKNERNECDEYVPNKIGRKRLKYGPNPITWTVSDLAKAGCLLHSPPIGTAFEDEQEMRRVYTLIYDVYRYKNVLMQALNDINFFQIFEQLQSSVPIVWLLFYDLYHRSFKKRETAVREIASRLFHHAKLSFAENALWCQRVKLAAAVSRLRIKYNALSLMELLPSHLRGDRVNKETQNIPVTVWINNRKFKNLQDIRKQIEQALKVKLVDDPKDLGPNTFKWDRHCPLTVGFHYSMRTQLAKSNLVRNHKLIVQDRSFCVGAATFWKVVEDLELSGSVIQTHVNSPRSTAYLANLLSQNEKIKKLMAFSAGRRKIEYENYLNELGMTNVVIYSDKLVDFGFEAPCMEEVVAVYATPPNSYSAVTDPIDLVCSRGGDLSMLEILTESEDTLEGRNRVTKILEEQRKTLKFAMSRPQIQVVLYETHSELDVENFDMVQTTLNEINRIAKLHHASLQGLISPDYMSNIQMPSELLKEINNNEEDKKERVDNKEKQSGENCSVSIPSLMGDDHCDSPCDLKNVHVPETDLFDTPELPCLCPEETNCKMEDGCYLALIQRKKVLKLDNKYMIQMAEQRGLFGSNSSNASKQKGSKQNRKKQQNARQEPKMRRTRRRLKDFEDISEIELTPESPQSIWRTDGAEIELEITGTDDDESKTMVKVTSKVIEEATRAGGILGVLTKDQLETLISPSYKVCCDPCFASPGEPHHRRVLPERSEDVSKEKESTKADARDGPPPKRRMVTETVRNITKEKETTKSEVREVQPAKKRIMSQWDEKLSKEKAAPKPVQNREPVKKSSISVNENFSWMTPQKKNIFEDLSRDAFGRIRKDPLSKTKSLCPTVPEDSRENIQEEKKYSTNKNKIKVDKKISSQKVRDLVSITNRLLGVKKRSSFRLFKCRLAQRSDEIDNKVIVKPSTTSSGYEVTVRPSGTFNINAGPVKIFKYSLDLRHIKGKLTEAIIERISMPTEASKIRSIKEECLPTCRRTEEGGTPTRDFMCECCKRRHS
ncbi:uncharacterized protein LOC123676237 isoform X2 [Harmonia axyridis]|nr:uncharacterized protein LOC123676237 isoform X2 [Harmonia axyridis]